MICNPDPLSIWIFNPPGNNELNRNSAGGNKTASSSLSFLLMMTKNGIQGSVAFTGKERDEETGYGYFGARYMDYELMTMWLSVDPMADKYPGISPYAYCAWNPVKLVDPDGREVYITIDNERYYLNIVNNKAIWKTKEGKPIVFDKGQPFFYKLTKSLNLLLSKDFGRNLVEELANDKVHELEIVKSSRDGACYETSTLGWTGFSSRGDYETTDYSNGGSPEFIRLAHELGHFYCKWYNTIENPEGVWFTYKNESGEEKPIRNCEKYALYVENMVRFEHHNRKWVLNGKKQPCIGQRMNYTNREPAKSKCITFRTR